MIALQLNKYFETCCSESRVLREADRLRNFASFKNCRKLDGNNGLKTGRRVTLLLRNGDRALTYNATNGLQRDVVCRSRTLAKWESPPRLRRHRAPQSLVRPPAAAARLERDSREVTRAAPTRRRKRIPNIGNRYMPWSYSYTNGFLSQYVWLWITGRWKTRVDTLFYIDVYKVL